MRTYEIGQRVEILGGLGQFIGKTGTIISKEEKYGKPEPEYYRVQLDEPVYLKGIGEVDNELWNVQHLKKIV